MGSKSVKKARIRFSQRAAAIGWKALERTDEAFRKYGHIFEFYNSAGPEIESLGRTGIPIKLRKNELN
jgi:dTDP-4-amino-4,6-dideoxygalactose transaminase